MIVLKSMDLIEEETYLCPTDSFLPDSAMVFQVFELFLLKIKNSEIPIIK